MPRKAKAKPKAKPAAPSPVTYHCSPMAMMIVCLARGYIAGKRGDASSAQAGPATAALARLIMSHDVEKLGKITPGKLEAYEKIAATVTTSAERYAPADGERFEELPPLASELPTQGQPRRPRTPTGQRPRDTGGTE